MSKKSKKSEAGFKRVTLSIPANLWPWIQKQAAKMEHAGNVSSFFRKALLQYKAQQ